jgi:hypothetical protein
LAFGGNSSRVLTGVFFRRQMFEKALGILAAGVM